MRERWTATTRCRSGQREHDGPHSRFPLTLRARQDTGESHDQRDAGAGIWGHHAQITYQLGWLPDSAAPRYLNSQTIADSSAKNNTTMVPRTHGEGTDFSTNAWRTATICGTHRGGRGPIQYLLLSPN